MTIEVRLKTGFFRTSAYKLRFDQGCLHFVPDDPLETEAVLAYSEILSVNMYEKKQPQFEILTNCHTYIGVFHNQTDFQKALHLYKLYSNLQIVYEFN